MLVALPATHTIDEDTAGRWTLKHGGGGHGSAVYQIVTPPVDGELVLDGDNVVYYPNAHYNGNDSFIFSVTKNGVTEQATVNIVVKPVDDPPLVYAGENQHVVLPAGASLEATVTDIDTDVEDMTIEWFQESGPGTVVFLSPGTLATTATFSEPGEYVLGVSARDGRSIRSDSIRIVVLSENTTGLPTVSMLSPEDESYHDLDTTLHLQVSAQAATGATIEKVEFYEGSRKIGEALAPDSVSGYYEMNWTPKLLGGYTLSAVALDSQGRSNVSSTVSVMIKYQGWFSGGGFVSGNNGFSGSGGNGGAGTGSLVGPGGDFFGNLAFRGGGWTSGGGGNGLGNPVGDNSADTDGDGLSDAEEELRETDPTREDTDGDGLLDGEDAVPTNGQMKIQAAPEVRYVVVDLGAVNEVGEPRGINDAGQVLLVNGNNVGRVWSGGNINNLGEGEFFSGILQNGDVYVGDLIPHGTTQNTWNYRVWNDGGWSSPAVWKETYSLEEWEITDTINVNSVGLTFPIYGDLAPLFDDGCSLLDMTVYGSAGPTWDYPFTQSVNGEFKIFEGGLIYYHASAEILINLDFSGFDEMDQEYVIYRATQMGRSYLGKWTGQSGMDYWGWSSKGVVKTEPMTRPVTYIENEDHSGVVPVWINEDGFIAGKEANTVSNWDTNFNEVTWVKPYEGMPTQLSSEMGEIKGLTKNTVGNGEGPYFRTNTGLVAYNGGNLMYEEISTFLPWIYPGTPRTISNSLVIPGGSSIWRNGRQWTMQELSGNSEIWSGISARLVSPEANLLAGTAVNVNSGELRAVLLVPLDIAVDANRDGELTLGRENTSEQKPFRFWVNSDQDDLQEKETLPPNSPDYSDGQIKTVRDLEDFTRLNIYIVGFHEAIVQGNIKVGLKWKNTTGSPFIKTWRNLSPEGGMEYLSDEVVAKQHLNLGNPGHVHENRTYMISTSYWQDVGLSAENSIAFLLFEGAGEGKGELVVTLHNSDGVEIGEGPRVWLHLVEVQKMFERAKGTPESIDYPHDYAYPHDDPPEPQVTWVQDLNGHPFDSSPTSWSELNHYIIFVHGWNVTYESAQNFAATTFKRLWQRGYRGRFAAYRWSTFVGILTYNDSEYLAWKYGEGLKQFVTSLPAGYAKQLMAHSMGNIVAGSALKKGLTVQNYALLNAAVPALCYDENAPVRWSYTTPDDDPDPGTRALAYLNKLSSLDGTLINFHLENDFATTIAWESNNWLFKPQRFNVGTNGYYYDRSQPPGQKLGISFVASNGRFVRTIHEAMAYVDQSRSKTVGAEPATLGAIDRSVDMSASYGFDTQHSAQWERSLQQTTPFYNRVLDEFGILFLP